MPPFLQTITPISLILNLTLCPAQAVLHYGSLEALPAGYATSLGLLLLPKPKGKVGRPPGKRKAMLEAAAVRGHSEVARARVGLCCGCVCLLCECILVRAW